MTILIDLTSFSKSNTYVVVGDTHINTTDLVSITVINEETGESDVIEIGSALPPVHGAKNHYCKVIYTPLITAINENKLNEVRIKYHNVNGVECIATVESYKFSNFIDTRTNMMWDSASIAKHALTSLNITSFNKSTTFSDYIHITVSGNNTTPAPIVTIDTVGEVGALHLSLTDYELVEYIDKKFKCGIPTSIKVVSDTHPVVFVQKRNLKHPLTLVSDGKSHFIILQPAGNSAITKLPELVNGKMIGIWIMTGKHFTSNTSDTLLSELNNLKSILGAKNVGGVMIHSASYFRPIISNKNINFVSNIFSEIGVGRFGSNIEPLVTYSDKHDNPDAIDRQTLLKFVGGIVTNLDSVFDLKSISKLIHIRHDDAANVPDKSLSTIIDYTSLINYAEHLPHRDNDPILKVKLAPKISRAINDYLNAKDQ